MNRLIKPRLVAHTSLWMLLSAGFMGAGHAVILPDEVMRALEKQDTAYVEQSGYKPVDLDDAFWNRYDQNLKAHIQKTGQTVNPNAMSMPDSNMGPIERAMRVMQAAVGELPRVRYHIEYRLANLPEHDYWEPHAHIQITRFNLGPALRREVVESYGAANTASPEEFGVGPHVRWRFVVGPVQNLNAHIWMASQQILSDQEAQTADCLGTPCLSTMMVEGPNLNWQALQAPVPNSFSDVAAATGIMSDVVLGESNLGYGENVEGANAMQPQLILVSTDGVGSDPPVDVLAYEPVVMDDAIQSMWLKRMQIDPNVDWFQLPIYRPGRQ